MDVSELFDDSRPVVAVQPLNGVSFRVGVIGGGQLARMMIPQAINLGFEFAVLAEAQGMSAALASSQVGDYRDAATVQGFASGAVLGAGQGDRFDVITFDHEHVPQPVLAALVADGVSVQPPAGALRLAQNKITMRQELAELGLPMPVWAAVHNVDELAEFLEANGGRCIVKMPSGGYDGKGVRLILEASEAADWFAAVDGPLLAEEAVDFRRELAQLSARSVSGEFRAWPLVETVQRDGVCVEVLAPAPGASVEQAERALEIARVVAENINDGLGTTGVLAVELFEREDGELLINELAMRPHNSGHWTMDGSVTGQFEQHLRAVLGLPLGSTAMREPAAVMINILGGPSDGSSLASRLSGSLAAESAAKVHLYGKDPRPGRKVGHVTAVGADAVAVFDSAVRAAAHFLD